MANLLIICKSGMKTAFLKKNLKDDYHLIFADSAEKGLEVLARVEINGILIDEQEMEEPLSLAKKIRKLPSYRLTPMLLITSSLKKSYTRSALAAGFTDFIHEPLEIEELYQRLDVAFSRVVSQKKMQKIPSIIAKTGKPAKKTKISLALRMKRLVKSAFFRELTKAHNIATPLCLVLIELDHYDDLLQSDGEKRAKELVKQLGAFIKEHLRTKDLLFAQGDHSFFAILPSTSSSAGGTLADLLREEVSRHAFHAETKEYSLTISAGLIYEGEKGEEAPSAALDKLVKGSFTALSEARKKGNRTVTTSIEELRGFEISI